MKDDDIDIEEEIDLDDPVIAADGELSGNALLHENYLTQTDSDRDQPEEDEEGAAVVVVVGIVVVLMVL